MSVDVYIDFSSLRAQALEHRPRLILCGHSSYPREVDYAAFKRIATEVGALTMADVSHIGGLIAGGVLRNPLVVDVMQSYGIDGAIAQRRLEDTGIVCNKQIIPDDPAPPTRPSGVRLGTPAATTRGMKESEMVQIGIWIDRVLRGNHAVDALGREVTSFARRFPIAPPLR